MSARNDGSARKARGQALAAEGRGGLGREYEAAVLSAMLNTAGYTGPVEVGTPRKNRRAEFPKKGRWVGPVVSRLRRAGILEPVRCGPGNAYYAATIAKRPTRHAGASLVWKVTDPEAAKRRLQRLKTSLRDRPQQLDLFDTRRAFRQGELPFGGPTEI